MRPKLLEIEGLQSFRDVQKIDFDSLGETGLFGIFGPTGSGKSTVLDAITFVLYGKVKRAERGTQGIINTSRNTAKVSFVFELFKDGKRKTYRVERTYQRKKGSENSCVPKIARLIEVTEAGEIPVCEKATEVSSSIEELLGLSHDDFTRAVVLPQNSFQEFLMLDNAKKRGMLERIFYLEEYGNRLNEKLSRKMSGLKSRIDQVGGALSAYEDASDEALKEAQEALDAAVLERERVEKELKQLEIQFNEAREVWQLVQTLEQIRQSEKEHLTSKKDIDEKRTQLEKAVKAAGLAELIAKTGELSGRLTETVKRLEEVLDKLPVVASGLNEIRDMYDKLKIESEAEKPKLVEFRTRLTDALGIKSEVEQMEIAVNDLLAACAKLKEDIEVKKEAVSRESREFAAVEQRIRMVKKEMEPLKTDPEHRSRIQEGVKLQNEVETIKGNLAELNKKAEALRKIIAVQDGKLEEITGKVENAGRAVEVLNVEKKEHEGLKPEDRNTAMKYREEVHKLQLAFGVLKAKKSELDGIEAKARKLQSVFKQNNEKLGTGEEERLKAAAFYEQCSVEKERAARAMETYTAHMLARDLEEGTPCPVCGSTHHPHPAVLTEGTEPAYLEQQLEESEKQLKAAEQALKVTENGCLLTAEQLKNVDEQIRQNAEEFAGKAEEYAHVCNSLPEELRELDLHQLGFALDRMKACSEEKLRAIDEWERKLETFRSSMQKLNEELTAQRMEENGISAGLKVNRENREQIENSIKESSRVYRDILQKYGEFQDNLQVESASAELKKLADNDRKINVMQKEVQQLDELLAQKRGSLEQLKEEVSVLTRREIKMAADTANYQQRKNEKVLKLNALVGDAGIEDELSRVNHKLEEYVKREKQYQDDIKKLETQHQELMTQKTTLENQKKIYTDNLQREQERLGTAIREKGFAGSDEVEKALLPEDRRKVLSEEISGYDKTDRAIQAQKEMVEKKLDSRSMEEEQWMRISDAFQEIAAYKEACVSRSEVAKSTFSTMKGKHNKWVELSKSYNELMHKHGLFEQIYKLLKAEKGKDNSFIDFIAEERLRYVAAKASETLGLITKHKYALELDSDIGFIIRDNVNGGVHRMVTSLSGGETFLTSLSLALALSEQIQLKGQSPLEFFFLDEGFGTLDNELLDTAIDSLERLSKKERVIGLISHVPELRNRIERRLIIEPPSYQGDGSRVRIEKT